jgi:plastocyanin
MGDMNVRRRLLLVLLAPFVFVACGDGDDPATDAAPTGVPDGSSPDTTSNGSPVTDTTPSPTGATSETAPETASSGAVITIERSRFSMDEIRVAVGTTVVWENLDGYAHTVTSTDDAPAAFDSSGLADGDRFEFTFDEPGTYPYFCQIHPTMRAVVIVG